MARPDFLRELQHACRRLKHQFSRQGRDWLTDVLTRRKGDGSILTLDRIFEFMCVFSLVKHLASRPLKLRTVQGVGKDKYRLPYSPGNKESFAFFRFELGGRLYDLCAGTGVPGSDGRLEHPDISLQALGNLTSTDDRRVGELIAFWDAKYHDNRASKGDFQQMNWWCDVLSTRGYEIGDILETVFPPAFQVKAVLTNAPVLDTNRVQLLRNRFSVVFNFNGDVNAAPSPSRADHSPVAPRLVKVAALGARQLDLP